MSRKGAAVLRCGCVRDEGQNRGQRADQRHAAGPASGLGRTDLDPVDQPTDGLHRLRAGLLAFKQTDQLLHPAPVQLRQVRVDLEDRGGEVGLDPGELRFETCLVGLQILQLAPDAGRRAVAQQDVVEAASDAALGLGQLPSQLRRVRLAAAAQPRELLPERLRKGLEQRLVA